MTDQLDTCCRNCRNGKLVEQKTPSGRRTLLEVRCRKFAPPEQRYGYVFPAVTCPFFEPREEA